MYPYIKRYPYTQGYPFVILTLLDVLHSTLMLPPSDRHWPTARIA